MGVWATYEARFAPDDPNMDPARNSALDHIRSRMQRKITTSLSYKRVQCGGRDIQLAIIDTTNDLSTKKIFSMPGEDLPHGSIIEWENSHWLVTEVGVGNDLCQKGKMRRCNYYLKWINSKGNIVGRWCVVEDGTKYLIGERQEDMLAVGDARMSVTIGKDSETVRINRGRRFLIDDMGSEEVLAYEVTKPNKMFNVFNGKGVFRFIMGESEVTDLDNTEERIADYYGWKPKEAEPVPDTKKDIPFEDMISKAGQDAKDKPAQIEKSGVWL